jgi:hypothetical protein
LKGALAYAAKILHEKKVVSNNFFKCMMEDAGADHDVCIDVRFTSSPLMQV